MSTYKIAGVSRLKGELKFRVANDMTRVKVLAKNDHSDIDLIELPRAMDKAEAVAYLLSIDFATKDGVTDAEVHGALLAEDDKRVQKTKAEKEPKAKKVKPTLEGIAAKKTAKKTAPKSTVTRKEVEAQLADMEESPF